MYKALCNGFVVYRAVLSAKICRPKLGPVQPIKVSHKKVLENSKPARQEWRRAIDFLSMTLIMFTAPFFLDFY
jgi:hypothetical protein